MTVPTDSRPGSARPSPWAILAAFLSSTAAGGVLVMKVNAAVRVDRDHHRDGMPCSMFCVRALNALQNSMMFTPCWPSAGPTGGDGFACPAGICSLISRDLLRHFASHLRHRCRRVRRPAVPPHTCRCAVSETRSDLLDLAVVENDRRRATEDRP